LNLQALYQNVSIFRNDICENDNNSENNSLKKKRRREREEKRIQHVEWPSPYMVLRHSGGGFYVQKDLFDSCGKFDMRL